MDLFKRCLSGILDFGFAVLIVEMRVFEGLGE
jgi:hypothetical protein